MKRAQFITGELSALQRAPRAAWLVLLIFCAAGICAVAQQITTNGLTDTTLSYTGHTATVTTATIVGGTGFNSFNDFNVYSGNTVRLAVPDGVTNLINLATNRGTYSTIAGLLTASAGSEEGIHVFLLNPNGWTMSSAGSVVAENVTFVTPTLDWCRTLFDGTNTPNPDAVAALLTGSLPANAMSTMTFVGRISARESINIHAGRVSVFGSLVAGDGTDPILKEGDIRIHSVNDVNHALGEIVAKKGNVLIHSDCKVKVQSTVRMAATGDIELQAVDEVYVVKGVSVCAGSNVVMQGSNLVRVAEKGNVHAGGSVIMKSANQTVISNAAYVVSQSVEGVPDTAVPLLPGWNLMAYNSPLVSPVSNVLAGIAGKYSMVCTHVGTDWKFYDPTNTAGSTLTNFEPGIGYWINATEATNLTLP